MSDTPVDTSKRTWLIASGCAGAVGGAFTAVPFVSSFQPSERAKAAGAAVEADISSLKPGEKMTVEWRGKPVWIMRRTKEELAALPGLDPELADPKSERKPDEFTPEYARNETRSIKPEFLVVVGICTHLDARPLIVFKPARNHRCLTTGRVASSALATVRHSIWQGGSSRTSRRRTIWLFRRTCICRTAGC